MPTVLKKGSARFFFFSNEGDEPKHIHVEEGHRYAKFWLEPFVELERSVGFKEYELMRLRKLVEEHSEFFKEKWDEHFQGA